MRIPEQKQEVYSALCVIRGHLRSRVARHNAQLLGKPLNGWTQEQHEAYHKKAIKECQAVAEWVFVELMRIDPD